MIFSLGFQLRSVSAKKHLIMGTVCMIKELWFFFLINILCDWSLTRMFQVRLLSTIHLKVGVLTFVIASNFKHCTKQQVVHWENCAIASPMVEETCEKECPWQSNSPGFQPRNEKTQAVFDSLKEWQENSYANCGTLLWDKLCRCAAGVEICLHWSLIAWIKDCCIQSFVTMCKGQVVGAKCLVLLACCL